jgi:predicted phosphodiesterase
VKIGIISDIHGNLQALRAVLDALDAEGVVKILCTGDIVGYGAYPEQCVELVRERGIVAVRGNHDDMVAYPGHEAMLRAEVRNAISWTREQLSEEMIEWLGQLPMETQYAGLDLVHSSHVFRPEWHYVMDQRSITANFLFQTNSLAFNGHTHLPLVGIHTRGQRPRLVMFREFSLPKDNRYLINVGSVGQPRDRNPEAAFVTYETRDRRVKLHRVKYDVEAAQRAIRKADLPAFFAERLADGR